MEKQLITNLSYLKSISNNNENFLQEMIDIFLKQTPEILHSIESNLEARHWTEFRALVHKIKPTIKMMGITRLDSVFLELDSLEKHEKNETELKLLIQNVKMVCNEACKELKDN